MSQSGVKIAIVVEGSRGDTQPYIALALGLLKAGFAVKYFGPCNMESFVRRHGIDAVGSGPDVEKIMEEEEAIRTAAKEGDFMKFVAAMDCARIRQAFRDSIKYFWTNLDLYDPHLILYGAGLGILCVCNMYQYARKVPIVQVPLALAFPSADFAPFGLPSMPIWTGLNRYMWKIIFPAIHKVVEVYKNIVEEVLNMDSGWSLEKKYVRKKLMWDLTRLSPIIIGSSPELFSRPSDWPDEVSITGWWVVDEAVQQRRFDTGDDMYGGGDNAQLDEFLKASDKPVYMGWGSMIVVSKTHMTCLAVRALKQAGKRGIILGGWARLAQNAISGVEDEAELIEYCRDNVLFMKTAPHAWLFPQCACVVHHGGSGTTAASVMAGIPTIITPVWVDQWDYKKAVTQKGIGIGLPSLTKVTFQELADAITQCCTDEKIQAAAKAMGEATSRRDGVGAAVNEISKFYEESVVTGKWRKGYEDELERNKPKARRGLRGRCKFNLLGCCEF